MPGRVSDQDKLCVRQRSRHLLEEREVDQVIVKPTEVPDSRVGDGGELLGFVSRGARVEVVELDPVIEEDGPLAHDVGLIGHELPADVEHGVGVRQQGLFQVPDVGLVGLLEGAVLVGAVVDEGAMGHPLDDLPRRGDGQEADRVPHAEPARHQVDLRGDEPRVERAKALAAVGRDDERRDDVKVRQRRDGPAEELRDAVRLAQHPSQEHRAAPGERHAHPDAVDE